MLDSPARPRIVGVSLKLYFDLDGTARYILDCAQLAPHALAQKVELFIIPDFLALTAAASTLRLQAPTIRLGAQDCFWEDSGAFTGEVSPKTLRGIGVNIVEIGHAERRRIFGETDDMVARKARAALRNGITPLVCIGEESQASPERAIEQCRPQMLAVLHAIRDFKDADVVWAYEPIWAIGAPNPASPDYVVAVTRGLRSICGDLHRIVYGGVFKQAVVRVPELI